MNDPQILPSDIVLKFTTGNDDESDVSYVTDVRKKDSYIEYYIIWSDPQKPPSWEKSIELTCYKKILRFWNGQNPPDIEIPSHSENPPDSEIPQTPQVKEKDITIKGIIKIGDTKLFQFNIQNDSEIRSMPIEEFIKLFPNITRQYFESNLQTTAPPNA